MKNFSKSGLAIILSRLLPFESPKTGNEQYATDSEAAATILWDAYMKGDIEGKTIADLGCGTGILGIGALILGAKKVFFVDNDPDAIKTAKLNVKSAEISSEKAEFRLQDISNFTEKCQTAIQNPPFGTKTRHADREFLLKAFQTASTVYSFHKSATDKFVREIAKDNGFNVTDTINMNMPLKKTMTFHKKRILRIEVSCYRMVRTANSLILKI